MDTKYLAMLYVYNSWANHRILRAAEGVSSEQLIAKVLSYPSSLRWTLVHVLSAEWIWLSRWQGVSPTAMLNEQDLPDLASIRERWQREEQNLRDFLATLRDKDLERVVNYTNTRGQALAFPLWQLMAHVVNHGTQHRSEAAVILTEMGCSPKEMDLVFFLQERLS